MSKAVSGYPYYTSTAWKRFLESVPCNYSFWKEGTEYRAECNDAGGADIGPGEQTAVLQDAVSALHDGGILFVRGEIEPLATYIDLAGINNLLIQGEGVDKTKIFGSSTGAFYKSGAGSSSNVMFRDLTINGNHQNTITVNLGNNAHNYVLDNVKLVDSGNHLAYSDVAYDLTVKNCLLSESGSVVGADAFPCGAEGALFFNNIFDKTTGAGGGCLTSGHMTHGRIIGNKFDNNVTCSYAAVSLETAYGPFEDIVVADNVMTGTDSSGGINVGNNVANDIVNTIVANNTLTGGGIAGISARKVTVTNNHIRNSHYGICFSSVDNAVIDGNTVENTKYNGAAGADKGGIYISVPNDNLVITNNTIFDSQTPKTTPYGIITDATYAVIANNRITDTTDGIILVAGAAHNNLAGNTITDTDGWAVALQAGATDNVVHDNIYHGNALGVCSDAGTDTIFDGAITPHSPADLSGAATTLYMTHPKMALEIMRAIFLYTEASSADAGITIQVGKEGDTDWFYTGTSEINKAQWYTLDLPSASLLHTALTAGDTVTFTSAGGKAGIGEILPSIHYIKGIY